MPSPAERISAIQDDFGEGVETLRKVLQHVGAARLDPNLRVVILNNVIVALTSTVEETIRDLFREYLSILEDTSASPLHLRNDLQRANFACAIEELKVLKNSSAMVAAAALASDLSKCLNGEPGYKLLKDKITYNKANFKSDQLTDVAKKSGISRIFEKICECSEIEEYTGKHGIQDRVSSITVAWNDIFTERDTIVHRISQASGWGETKITESFDLCVLVITRLTECLIEDAESQVTHLNGRAAASAAAVVGSVEPVEA